ncbi:MAG: DNA-binding protein WhiA [Clostridiales bacterium]|jgi:DNA-binding protein WhiA|nr:DNA-binding protein WhiA [Clostridiales bacterium]
MSFSSDVKKEIYDQPLGARHCRIAMLSAIINGAVKVTEGPRLSLKTENLWLARRFYRILKEDFNASVRLEARAIPGGMSYILTADKPEDALIALKASGLWDDELLFSRRISSLVIRGDCCRKAYLAGTFLACGYIGDPESVYHCEFIAGDAVYAEELKKLWSNFGLTPRSVTRKSRNGSAVYFKDAEQISDILNITGAHGALMRFENARIRKDVENKINRNVNCDSANMDKAISAAVKQTEDINVIRRTVGIGALPASLADIITARLEYPEISLKELGGMMSPPIGKSGVNHRLRRIHEIALNIKEENYDFTHIQDGDKPGGQSGGSLGAERE